MTSKRPAPRLALVGTSFADFVDLMPFARALAQARGQQLLLVGLVFLPEQESLSAGARTAQQLRRSLAPLLHSSDERVSVRVTHDVIAELDHVRADNRFDLALVQRTSPIAPDILRSLACDVVVVHGQFNPQLCRILLPIRGGPSAALALQIALALAEAQQAHITLLHAIPPALFRKPQTRELLDHLSSLPQISNWVRVRGDAATAIISHAQPGDHQLLIMGAIARPQRGDPPIGPTATRVMDAVEIPVLIVRSRPPVVEEEQPPTAPPVDYTISVVVDKWFGENTFHAHEFDDIRALVALKERQGLTISLGLPTLNEQETIGNVIQTVRKKFVEAFPLIDEIVVIDSNSTDNTVAIAENLDVPVFKHPQVLNQYGTYTGKGEALWDSLYILRGDLIAWIDTDIVNIHPRFVYGILGPLIREPHLMYVKGFYQRPLKMGRKLEARGGGRVTELVARPLLNLFYPELSGFVQPLAGEYAGRREALDKVPFFVGYGVEIGLLIDLWSRFGLGAMGQVDLEERVHRNQSLIALSKMAFEITQVVMQRVGEARGTELLDDLHKSIKLIRYERDEFRLDVADIRARERPPMITIPEYRQRRGLE